jgi:hypothetical protein
MLERGSDLAVVGTVSIGLAIDGPADAQPAEIVIDDLRGAASAYHRAVAIGAVRDVGLGDPVAVKDLVVRPGTGLAGFSIGIGRLSRFLLLRCCYAVSFFDAGQSSSAAAR